MRTHGWAGNPPASDDEAVRRILDAAKTCIDRDGATTSIVDVARELGVTRQTVYRYYRSTEDLLVATATDASAAFLDRVGAHLTGLSGTPAEILVEGMAYALERLPEEPYLGLLLAPGRLSALTEGVTSETAMALGRMVLDRYPIDWAATGFDDDALNELVEQTLRVTQSFVIDPGTPPRTGEALRGYLRRWVAPCIDARAQITT